MPNNILHLITMYISFINLVGCPREVLIDLMTMHVDSFYLKWLHICLYGYGYNATVLYYTLWAREGWDKNKKKSKHSPTWKALNCLSYAVCQRITL